MLMYHATVSRTPARNLGCYDCGLGASTTVTSASSGASTGASVGTAVLPGIGTAVGAVVGAVAGALFRSKKDPNAAEKAALKGQLDDYMRVMGQVPGRAFNLTTLVQLIDGAGYRGLWPAVKKWSGDAITGAIDGCKGCTPPTIREWVRQAVAGGQDNPLALADQWSAHVKQTWGSKWFVADAGNVQRQLIVDLLDYFVAQNKPDAPLYYALSWSAGAQTPTPAPTPTTPVPAMTPTVTPLPAPTSPAPSSTITPAVADNTKAVIDALLAQGASQQQAFAAALQSLAAQGVQPTPQLQQAVADEVKTATPSTAGFSPTFGVAAAGIGLLALTFALARPASQPRRRRSRR